MSRFFLGLGTREERPAEGRRRSKLANFAGGLGKRLLQPGNQEVPLGNGASKASHRDLTGFDCKPVVEGLFCLGNRKREFSPEEVIVHHRRS